MAGRCVRSLYRPARPLPPFLPQTLPWPLLSKRPSAEALASRVHELLLADPPPQWAYDPGVLSPHMYITRGPTPVTTKQLTWLHLCSKLMPLTLAAVLSLVARPVGTTEHAKKLPEAVAAVVAVTGSPPDDVLGAVSALNRLLYLPPSGQEVAWFKQASTALLGRAAELQAEGSAYGLPIVNSALANFQRLNNRCAAMLPACPLARMLLAGLPAPCPHAGLVPACLLSPRKRLLLPACLLDCLLPGASQAVRACSSACILARLRATSLCCTCVQAAGS